MDNNPYERSTLARIDRQRAWAADNARSGQPTPRSPRALHADEPGWPGNWPRDPKPAPIPAPEPAMAPAPAPGMTLQRPASPLVEPTPTLQARALKVTCVLDAAEIASVRVGYDQPRVSIRVQVGGRMISADMAGKTVRKAQRTITELAGEGVFCMLQGRLLDDDKVAEAGLIVQSKAPKPASC
jgi:hypothetical protein